MTTLVDIPFSISPVIAGLAFIMTFGRMGWAMPYIEALGDWLDMDIQIVFALLGVVLATIFVTFPFVFREIMPVLSADGRDEEAAAALMGASGWTILIEGLQFVLAIALMVLAISIAYHCGRELKKAGSTEKTVQPTANH